MAARDVKAIEVIANGRFVQVTYDTMALAGTHDLGGDWNAGDYGWETSDNLKSSANIVLTVTSKGFADGVATTRERTVVGVPFQQGLTGGSGHTNGFGVMRKPWQGSGDPVRDETNSGGDCVCVYALSEPVFSKDKSGAGNSGVDITATVAAGTYNDGSNDNNAYSGAVTNSSTLDYPTAFGQWSTIQAAFHADRLFADFALACHAYCFMGVDSVKFTVSDQSANSDSQTISSKTFLARSNTPYGAEEYRTADFDLSQFVQGDQLDGRMEVYPFIGDTAQVFDSDDFTTVANLGWFCNKLEMICDKDDVLEVVKYVAASGGTDDLTAGRGDTAGDPYATIGYALLQGATTVKCLAGTHTGTTDPGGAMTASQWGRIVPNDGLGVGDVIISLTNRGVDYEFKMFDGVTIQAATTTARFVGASTESLRFRNCDFDLNGFTLAGTASLGVNCNMVLLEECTGDVGDWRYGGGGRYGFDGMNLLGTADNLIDGCYKMTSCYCTKVRIGQRAGGTHLYTMIQNTALFDCSDTVILFNDHAITSLVIANVVAEVSSGTNQVWNIQSEKDAGYVGLYNVNQRGERSSMFYSDSVVTAAGVDFPQLQGCQFQRLGLGKQDDFIADATNVGNWPAMMACGFSCNIMQTTLTLPIFPPEFIGLNSRYDTDPTYVDDAGGETGSGLGEGDYRDTNATTQELPWDGYRHLDFDITGRVRPLDQGIFTGPWLPVPNAATSLVQV